MRSDTPPPRGKMQMWDGDKWVEVDVANAIVQEATAFAYRVLFAMLALFIAGLILGFALGRGHIP